MSLVRVDALFLTSRPRSRVALLGTLSEWRAGLEAAGLAIDEAPTNGPVDLLITEPRHLRAALALRPRELLMEGRADARVIRAAGLTPQVVAALPVIGAAERFVPVDDVVAARYALRTWPGPNLRSRLTRRAVGASAPWVLSRLSRVVTLASRVPAQPFLVQAATAHGIPPDVGWFFSTRAHYPLGRSLFHLFPPGSPRPAWVLKFTRIRQDDDPRPREERGLAAARAAGDVVLGRAPARGADVECDGIHGTMEEAVGGRPLDAVLAAASRTSTKRAWIDRVAGWLLEVGRATGRPPELRAADPVMREVRDNVDRSWASFGAPSDLWDRVRSAPATFQHGDLNPENVIVDGRDFRVVDWERARLHGFPLGDLIFFLVESVASAYRLADREARVATALRLLKGRHPESQRSFAWIARAGALFGACPATIGALATIAILERGTPLRRGDGAAEPLRPRARLAQAWLRDPGLGPEWTAFRQWATRAAAS